MSQDNNDMDKKMREVMSFIGSIKSDKKKKSSAQNGQLGGRPLKPLNEIECKCGGSGLDHQAGCPRGRVIRYRQKKGLPLE